MSDLKPCPYCGGEAHLSVDTSHSTAFFIGCETEDCFGLMMWAERQDAAIAAWNTRAIDPVLTDPRVKVLVEAVDYILDGMGIGSPDYKIDPEDEFLDAANGPWVMDTLSRLAAALRAIGGEA